MAKLQAATQASSIPLIDFGAYADGTLAGRRETALALRAALEQYGFCYVARHGVPDRIVADLFAQSRAFFSLPQPAREAALPREPGSTRGYGGVATQALDESQPGDLKEVFQAGPEHADARSNPPRAARLPTFVMALPPSCRTAPDS